MRLDVVHPEKKEIRVLFTSVGRRVELMQAFHNAADKLGLNLTIYGADISESAPALFFCDMQKIICRIDDPQYIPQLLAICQHERIDALIPTIDTDLLLLSRVKDQFANIGTRVVISSEDKVQLCRDKRFTADYFISCGLKSPRTVDDYSKYSMGFPCFIKPKDGSSSINAFKINNAEDMEAYTHQVCDYIIQPFIEGVEYTVDIFCDFDGNPIFITPRERIGVRSGEVLKTRICQDETIIEECKKLIACYKPCGAITVQLIQQRSTGDNYYIEINPRFGGGATLSMKAGADAAGAMLRLLDDQTVGYQPLAATDGAVYSRFDQSICIANTRTSTEPEIKAVIFDLDDTLYSEKEYVRSGYNAVAEVLSQVGNCADKLWSAFLDGKNAIDAVLTGENIYTDSLKQKCLEAYREHMPTIHLYDGVKEMLLELHQKGIKMGIITDGRPHGQRNKIKALGLDSLVDEIIVTDELGGAQFRKPNDIAFRVMRCRMGVPYKVMVYVGDNPQKDFNAPRALNMQRIWFKNDDGLYSTRFYTKLDIRVQSVQELRKLLYERN